MAGHSQSQRNTNKWIQINTFMKDKMWQDSLLINWMLLKLKIKGSREKQHNTDIKPTTERQGTSAHVYTHFFFFNSRIGVVQGQSKCLKDAQVWWRCDPRGVLLPNSWLGGYNCENVQGEDRQTAKETLSGKRKGSRRENSSRARGRNLCLCGDNHISYA